MIYSISECFLKNDAQRGWSGLKKISKPSYSPSQSPVYIKDKEGNVLVSQEDQLNRFAEHYEELASDITGHSLNENYWKRIFNNSSSPQESWDINQPISMSEIHSTVLSMKNNKAPGPDGIPTEFFKVFLILRVEFLLRMTLIKRLLIPIVQSVGYYFLIKFGMVTFLMNGTLLLLFLFLKKKGIF